MRWLLAALAALLVFVALASIFASIAAHSSEGEIAKSKRTMRAVQQAIQIFRMKQNHIPASLAELCGPAGDSGRCLAFEEPPKDPWGNDFVYTLRDTRNYDLACLGSDGAVGGEGDAKDITLADIGEPAGDD